MKEKIVQLLPATAVGLVYFALAYAAESDIGLITTFIYCMTILPGITFPITTCYFNTRSMSYRSLRVVAHLISSMAIYIGIVFFFTLEERYDWIISIDGFLGSFLFLLMTRFILKFPIKLINILFCALISGLAFLPTEIWNKDFRLLGAGILIWTIVNAYTVIASKKQSLTTPKN